MWSVEPKAPSLVSLSVRDQNIPRPPKRSSSLKAAASKIKKGLSSHQLSKSSACDSLQTLRRGQHHSCSSLQVKKTRTRATPPAFLCPSDEIQHRGSSGSPAFDAVSSDGTLLDVFEHYWDGLSQICTLSMAPRRPMPHQPGHLIQSGSSETIVHNEVSRLSRASSDMSSGTFHTASQTRQQSVRRLVTRMLKTVQMKRKGSVEIERDLNMDRIEAWVHEAESNSVLAADMSGLLPAVSRCTQSSDASHPAGLAHRSEVKQSQDWLTETNLKERTSG